MTSTARLTELVALVPLLLRARTARLVDPADLRASFALRGRVFADHLGWVERDDEGLDRDAYDDEAVHLGVLCGERLLGSMRLIRGPEPWMLHREFAPLVAGASLQHGPASVEITRLAVEPALGGTLRGVLVRAMLYRALVRWAQAHGVRRLYAVVTGRYAASLHRRYGFEPLGVPWRFGDGPLTTAVVCDLHQQLRCLPLDAPLEALWLFGPVAVLSAGARSPRGPSVTPPHPRAQPGAPGP